jgi:AraC family transcriptional regulator
MPDASQSGQLLRGGEFYSPLAGRLCTDEVLLSELRPSGTRNVPRHEHELAYVTVVLDGDYLEGDRKLEQLRPLTAVFNPSGISHTTVIGPAGAALFTIEIRTALLKQLSIRIPQQTTFDRGAGAMLWPGLRLYSAFKSEMAEPLVVDSHVLDILGAIGQLEPTELTPPRWFGQVKERLHEEFRQNLRMSDLAQEAGIHPVHLARVFRIQERQTPGDYLRRVRVRLACDLLRDPEWRLAAIAAECGFADQSHFTRIFKRVAGSTPAQFRRACGAWAATPARAWASAAS